MYKSVYDGDVEQVIEGFTYVNKNGDTEYVKLDTTRHNPMVSICLYEDGEGVEIYHQDIPHLISALHAAYDHIKGN